MYETVVDKAAPRAATWFPRVPTNVGSTGEIFSYPYDVTLQETTLSGEDILSRLETRKIFVSFAATDNLLSTVADRVVLLEPVGATTVSRGLGSAQPIVPPFDQLSPMAASAVTSRWQVPCEAAFDFLAESFPSELMRLVSMGKLESVDLTLAAESLGHISIGDVARRALIPLLDHSDAMVREGAIYGLRKHANAETRARLARMVTSDPSCEVRQVASDALLSS